MRRCFLIAADATTAAEYGDSTASTLVTADHVDDERETPPTSE